MFAQKNKTKCSAVSIQTKLLSGQLPLGIQAPAAEQLGLKYIKT